MPMGCGRPSLWGTYFKMQTALEYALALSCLGRRVPIRTPLGFRNTTSPAAYDATLLQKEMLSRSYLSLSLSVLELKAFCCRVPKPKDSFPPRRRRRRRRRRWRREMTPPPAKYSLISASIFRGGDALCSARRLREGTLLGMNYAAGEWRIRHHQQPTPPPPLSFLAVDDHFLEQT